MSRKGIQVNEVNKKNTFIMYLDPKCYKKVTLVIFIWSTISDRKDVHRQKKYKTKKK